jgi:hypothetical protein
MRNTPLACDPPLSASQIADVRLAASKMTGPTRRACQAEMTLKYCQGNPLQAETVFGWGRHTVALGWSERRTGIVCLGAQAAFSGRKRGEDQPPESAAVRRQRAEAPAPQAPTFRTPLAYTRLTAQAALAALAAQGESAEPWPAPRTLAEGLKRMGLRWRPGGTAKAPQKLAETEAIGAPIEQKPRRRWPRPAAPACVALGQPPWRSVPSPVAASRVAISGRVLMTWAGTSNIVPGGSWRKTGRGGASPLGVLSSPAMSSLSHAKPGGRRWRRPRRRPGPGCSAQGRTVPQAVGSARSVCTAWCSVPPRWARPSTGCMTRPLRANPIPWNGVGGCGNGTGMGRSWAMASPGSR